MELLQYLKLDEELKELRLKWKEASLFDGFEYVQSATQCPPLGVQ